MPPVTVTTSEAYEPEDPTLGLLHVVADDPESMQNRLDRAVEKLREAAADGNMSGILVTRQSRSVFTVQLSADVPFGLTVEMDRWQRRTAPLSGTRGDEAGQ